MVAVTVTVTVTCLAGNLLKQKLESGKGIQGFHMRHRRPQ
jgi:hypothetical protein